MLRRRLQCPVCQRDDVVICGQRPKLRPIQRLCGKRGACRNRLAARADSGTQPFHLSVYGRMRPSTLFHREGGDRTRSYGFRQVHSPASGIQVATVFPRWINLVISPSRVVKRAVVIRGRQSRRGIRLAWIQRYPGASNVRMTHRNHEKPCRRVARRRPPTPPLTGVRTPRRSRSITMPIN